MAAAEPPPVTHLVTSPRSNPTTACLPGTTQVVRFVLCCVSGVGAGVFGSLVGLGGAFVMIPALTGVLKASQHQAHGKQPPSSTPPSRVSWACCWLSE